MSSKCLLAKTTMKKFYTFFLTTILLALSASAQNATRMSLGGIILNGEEGEFYTISNKLIGVYVPPRFTNVIYAKDKNTSTSPSRPSDAQLANNKIYDVPETFDQSNWVKVLFPVGYDASAFEGKELTNITGRFNIASAPGGPVGLYVAVDENNPPQDTGSPVSFTPNIYNTANFVEQPTWFLVKPKNLEYCTVRWAIYAGENLFIVPKHTDAHNQYSLPGSFKVDMTMWEQQTDDNSITADNVFTVNHSYEFAALVEFSKGSNVGLNIDPGFDGDINYAPRRAPARVEGFEFGDPGSLPEGYHCTVFPLRLIDEVITGVEQTVGERSVESVRYSLQGRLSATPHAGMNIVVTTYSDGSTTTRKTIW